MKVLPNGVLVLCLGNPLRGDDAFGLLVYRLLRRLGVRAIYAGTTPENTLKIVRKEKPRVVVIVDALLGGDGNLIVSRLAGELTTNLISTHLLPLKLLFQSVNVDPENVIVVGARAENISLGSRPSERVRELAVEAAALIARLLRQPQLPREPELADESFLVTRNIENPALG